MAFSEIQQEVSEALARNGNLTAEDQKILDKMRELYVEVEYLDLIRIGVMGVLEQGEVSARFDRRVKELCRDLNIIRFPDSEASVSP